MSAETLLSIEYIRARLPPTPQASFAHDDWVSAVDVLSASSAAATAGTAPASGHARLASASYDGVLRVWDMSGNVVAATNAAAEDARTVPSLLAARFLSPATLVSAGWDARIRVHAFVDSTGPGAGTAGSLTPLLDLYGHTGPVTSLAVSPTTGHILSASHDGTARLWSATTPGPAAPSHLLPTSLPPLTTTPSAHKRRKLSLPAPPPSHTSLLTLTHPTPTPRPVSSALFAPHDATIAYTASTDRHLRTYDLTTSALVTSRQLSPHAALTSLAALSSRPGLVAAGTATRAVLLADARHDARAPAIDTLRGHRGAVVALAPEPVGAGAGWGLVSAGLDGTVRVWDLRNVKADVGGVDGAEGRVAEAACVVGRGKGEEGQGRVFGVAWDEEVGIVSAGEKGGVVVYK